MVKKVIMGLQKKDVERLSSIQKRLNSKNKASAVGSAIQIANIVVGVISEGGEVIIFNKDGSREKITISQQM